MAIEFKAGRLPHDANPARLMMDRYVRSASVPRASADWVSQVRSWPMLLNDQLGDCTAAGAGHVAQQVNRYGRDVDAPVTDDDTLAMYKAISGYQPGNDASDVGATLQDALNYWRTTGIGGNKISAFAQITATNLDAIRLCIAQFGAVYCGMNLPKTAMQQFNAGKPWTVAARSQNLGGHCVPLMAYTPDTFTCITWAKTQQMSVAFFKAQFDEVWVPIDLDWMRANGVSPAGIDTAALNADYAALTGQPGPFPTVTPGPAPAPGAPRAADVAFAAAFDTWRRAAGV